MIIDYVKSLTGRMFTMDGKDAAPDDEAKALLFAQVRYHLVLNDTLDDESAERVSLFPDV